MGTSPVARTVKNPPAVQETWVRSLGWEDPLEEDMATHSSILTWTIPMDRSTGSPGVGHAWVTRPSTHTALTVMIWNSGFWFLSSTAKNGDGEFGGAGPADGKDKPIRNFLLTSRKVCKSHRDFYFNGQASETKWNKIQWFSRLDYDSKCNRLLLMMLRPPWDCSPSPHAVNFFLSFFFFLDNISTLLAGSFKPPSWSCGKVTRVSFSSWADLLNFTCWTRLRKWDTGTRWINGDPILNSVVQSLEPNPHILVSGLTPSQQTWPSVLKGWGWEGFKKLIKKSQNASSTSNSS